MVISMRRLSPCIALLSTALALLTPCLAAEGEAQEQVPGDESKTASASDSVGKPVEAPEGVFDLPQLREHRRVVSIASSVGVAGGLGLMAYGIYTGLSQGLSSGLSWTGFSCAPVQTGVIEAACGLALCGIFSFCLNVSLDQP